MESFALAFLLALCTALGVLKIAKKITSLWVWLSNTAKTVSQTPKLLFKIEKTNQNIIESLDILKKEFDSIRNAIESLKADQENGTQTVEEGPELKTIEKKSLSVVFEKEYDQVFTSQLQGEAQHQVKSILSQLRILGFEISTNISEDSLGAMEFSVKTKRAHPYPTTC